MTSWTRTPPREPGFYWVALDGDLADPWIHELAEDQRWYPCSSEVDRTSDLKRRKAQFWPVRIEPPGGDVTVDPKAGRVAFDAMLSMADLAAWDRCCSPEEHAEHEAEKKAAEAYVRELEEIARTLRDSESHSRLT